MASNYLKRKAKESSLTPLTKEEETPEFTHIGYDVYGDKANANFNVIVFDYNPETNDIQIKEKKKIGRQLALTFEERKKALKTLARLK